MPDMNIHAKIPVDLFHKLPCDMFRIEFPCLCACPFNFEICGIFEELLAITAIPRITVLNFTTKPQLLRNKKKNVENLRVEIFNAISTEKQCGQLTAETR